MTAEQAIAQAAAELEGALASGTLVRACCTGPIERTPGAASRVDLRGVRVRGEALVQVATRVGERETHRNLPATEAVACFRELMAGAFRQAVVRTAAGDLHVTLQASGRAALRRTGATGVPFPLTHDRAKAYLIPEGEPCPFLQRLGVMTADGRVVAARQAKFRQINRYLEVVADVLPDLPATGVLRVVDFGSGKSYLTFALHHYLHTVLGREVEIVGLDLKADVVAACEAIARELGADGLRFEAGDIAGFQAAGPVDLVVSLHACDTATDDALGQAVAWGARVVLAAPCCQHELARHIASDVLQPVLKHGILRERFAAILTDALRAGRLEMAGYRVQILEFIETEHTPRNLLIRAVRGPGRGGDGGDGGYAALRDFFAAHPHIDRVLPEPP